MPETILDMPYEVSVRGTPRRKRVEDLWRVRRSLPVAIRSLEPSDVESRPVLRGVRGDNGTHRSCLVVGGLLHIPTAIGVADWQGGIFERARLSDGLHCPINPTPIAAFSKSKVSAFHQGRLMTGEFSAVSDSDEVEAQAAAVGASRHLAVLDGMVYSSRYEPAVVAEVDARYDFTVLVDITMKPSRFAASFASVQPSRPSTTLAGNEAGIVGEPDSFISRIDVARYGMAFVLADCMRAVFPDDGSGIALVGSGRPGNSTISEELEDAVYGLRDALRLVDANETSEDRMREISSNAVSRFVSAIGNHEWRQVSGVRLPAIRKMLKDLEATCSETDRTFGIFRP